MWKSSGFFGGILKYERNMYVEIELCLVILICLLMQQIHWPKVDGILWRVESKATTWPRKLVPWLRLCLAIVNWYPINQVFGFAFHYPNWVNGCQHFIIPLNLGIADRSNCGLHPKNGRWRYTPSRRAPINDKCPLAKPKWSPIMQFYLGNV